MVQDLLAAGYGSIEFGKTTNGSIQIPFTRVADFAASAGLILLWSLKNPKFPHKVIKTKHRFLSSSLSGVS